MLSTQAPCRHMFERKQDTLHSDCACGMGSIAVALLQMVQGTSQRQKNLALTQQSQARLLRQGEGLLRLQTQPVQRQGQLPLRAGQSNLRQGQMPLSWQTLWLKMHWASMLTSVPQSPVPSHRELVQQHQQGQERMHLLMKETPCWMRWKHVCMAWSSSCSRWHCRNLVRLTAAVSLTLHKLFD